MGKNGISVLFNQFRSNLLSFDRITFLLLLGNILHSTQSLASSTKLNSSSSLKLNVNPCLNSTSLVHFSLFYPAPTVWIQYTNIVLLICY